MYSETPYAEDLVLRDQIVQGDRVAAEAFMQGHLEGLYEFIHYRVGVSGSKDRARVEDLVQETFLVALERMSSFDGRSRLSTWLYGIAKNKLRSAARVRRHVPIEDLLVESDAEIEAILGAVDREPLPDWILEQEETRELVGATLSSLPVEYRRALIDKYIDGLSVSQMAEKTGKGEKATESHLARARLAFAKIFQLLGNKRGEVL